MNCPTGKSPLPPGRRLTIELWADVACPWCYIGKRRLENAIEASGLGQEIDIVLHTFELDSAAPIEPVENLQYVAQHMGVSVERARELEHQVEQVAAREGLPFTPRRIHANSLNALRLLQLARSYNAASQLLGVLQNALFTGRTDVYSSTFLIDAAHEVGIPRDDALTVLESDQYAADVRADHASALQLGATGVPFAVVDGRYGIQGVVSTSAYQDAISTAWNNE